MSLTLSPYVCALFINHPPNGWSERWNLPDGNITDARATATLLAQARSYLLAQDCVIEWAVARLERAPYVEWAAIDAALPALPQWGVVHDDFHGLLWRFETANGRWANHLFRAVADDQIDAAAWIGEPYDVPAGAVPPPPVPAAATIPDLYDYCMTLFRDRTCHARRWSGTGPPGDWWELTPWERVIYRKVSGRAWGSAYRRVSWEPREYAEQPGFTPCGTAVTVLRACYEVDCRFFTGAPVQGVRYYWADPAAAVFPMQSIFWAWARDKDAVNVGDPGETTGPAARTYHKGLSWGVAPGIVPDGLQQQFLGQTASPWGSSPTTPAPYVVVCDMPAPIPILFDEDPAGVSDANVVHVTTGGPNVQLEIVAPGWVKLVVPHGDAEDRRDHNAWRAMTDEATMAGRWYTTWETGTQYYHSPIGIPTGYAVATPVFPGSGGTVLAIAFQVTTVNTPGKVTRVGLYEAIDADTPSPGVLLFDSGDIGVGSPGLKETNCNVALAREKLYFLVLLSDGNQTDVIYEGVDTTFMFPTWGRDKNDLTLFAGAKLQVPHAYFPFVNHTLQWPPADGPGVYNLTTPVVAVRFTGALAHARLPAGLELGGAPDIAWEVFFDATGGLELGGDPGVAWQVFFDATGGLELGGAADVFEIFLADAVGGLELGGDASVYRVAVVDATGGLELGGDAAVAVLNNFDATGGLELGGDAAVAWQVNFSAIGGLELGGDATVYRVEVVDAVGGLELGGAADYDFDPGSSFQEMLPDIIASAFTNPDEMKTDDGVFATFDMTFPPDSGITSATDFDFTTSGTIVGFEVKIKCKESAAAIKLDLVQLENLGLATGDNKGTAAEISTVSTEYVFGGPADMWGTSLTSAQINGITFGVRFRFTKISGTPTVSVDYVKIKVYYTP